ncbi:MAG: hypothetical protein K0Q69_707 [Devosia sp.]|jgi:hypothetical protein|nr:hypothetical protein [Devosia sp.]
MEALQFETEFINLWAETGAYRLVVRTEISKLMRRLGVDLVDIHHVLKNGSVTRSDMIEDRGLWDVSGTTEGTEMTVCIAVDSKTNEVEILDLVKGS